MAKKGEAEGRKSKGEGVEDPFPIFFLRKIFSPLS